jgi:hypothetical protein
MMMADNKLIQIIKENNTNGLYDSLLTNPLLPKLTNEDLLHMGEDDLTAFVSADLDKSLMRLVTSRFRDRIWPLIFTSEKENFDLEPHLSTKVYKLRQTSSTHKLYARLLSEFISQGSFRCFRRLSVRWVQRFRVGAKPFIISN